MRDPLLRAKLRSGALERAKLYQADRILDDLLRDVGLTADPNEELGPSPVQHDAGGDEELGAWSVEASA